MNFEDLGPKEKHQQYCQSELQPQAQKILQNEPNEEQSEHAEKSLKDKNFRIYQLETELDTLKEQKSLRIEELADTIEKQKLEIDTLKAEITKKSAELSALQQNFDDYTYRKE